MVDDFIAAVDAFLPLQKTLVGAHIRPVWRPGREPGEYKLLLPLEIDGEQRGQQLLLLAYPNNPTLMFKIGIQFLDHVICRLDFELEAVHGNNFSLWGDGLPYIVSGPHWHKWEINRSHVHSTGFPFKLPNAVPYSNSRQFDATLRFYCAERFIEIGKHEIDLPPRDSLF